MMCPEPNIDNFIVNHKTLVVFILLFAWFSLTVTLDKNRKVASVDNLISMALYNTVRVLSIFYGMD